MRRGRWVVAVGLALVQAALASGGGRAEPIAPEHGLGATAGGDGVWAGHEAAPTPGAWVTLQVRGKTLVFTDATSVWVGPASWQIGGPGTKAGALDFEVAWKLQAAVTLNGRPSRIRAGQKSLLRVRLDPAAGTLAFCMTPPGSPAKRPSSASGAGEGHGVRCFALTRVAAPPPAEPDFECMRECRQANMARAVSADQIDADCRWACTSDQPQPETR